MQYKPGDRLKGTGQVISKVVGQGSHACVVITVDNQIRWEWQPLNSDTPPRLQPAIAAFMNLVALGRRVVTQGKRGGFRDELAEALWASIDSPEGSDVTLPFQQLRERFEFRWRRRAALSYLAGAICIVVLSALPFLYVLITSSDSVRLTTAAIAGGAAGALLSILQRIRNLQVDDVSPLWYWSLEGSVRAFLGALCGGIILSLVNLDLVLGFAKGTASGLFFAGVLAGFVERFVPSLLIRMAESSGKAKGAGKVGP